MKISSMSPNASTVFSTTLSSQNFVATATLAHATLAHSACCIPTAEKNGVVLGLENHWGLGLTSKGVMKIVNAINSPWLSVTLDTGNFFDNREEQIKT